MAATSGDPTTKPAVPHAGPAWLTVERIAYAAVLWPCVGTFLHAFEPGWTSEFWAAVDVLDRVAIVCAQIVVAGWIARAPTPRSTLRRAFLVQPALGVAAVSPVILRYPAYATSLAGGLALHGALHGCILAVCQATTATVALRVLRGRALDTTDRVLAHASALAALSVTAVAALPALLYGEATASLRNLQGVAVAIIAPLLVAGWAWARLRARKAWIRRVEAGEVRGWRIEHDLPDNAADLPPFARRPGAAYTSSRVRVLVHGEDPRAPFRDARTAVPVALVLDDDAPAMKSAATQG